MRGWWCGCCSWSTACDMSVSLSAACCCCECHCCCCCCCTSGPAGSREAAATAAAAAVEGSSAWCLGARCAAVKLLLLSSCPRISAAARLPPAAATAAPAAAAAPTCCCCCCSGAGATAVPGLAPTALVSTCRGATAAARYDSGACCCWLPRGLPGLKTGPAVVMTAPWPLNDTTGCTTLRCVLGDWSLSCFAQELSCSKPAALLGERCRISSRPGLADAAIIVCCCGHDRKCAAEVPVTAPPATVPRLQCLMRSCKFGARFKRIHMEHTRTTGLQACEEVVCGL